MGLGIYWLSRAALEVESVYFLHFFPLPVYLLLTLTQHLAIPASLKSLPNFCIHSKLGLHIFFHILKSIALFNNLINHYYNSVKEVMDQALNKVYLGVLIRLISNTYRLSY